MWGIEIWLKRGQYVVVECTWVCLRYIRKFRGASVKGRGYLNINCSCIFERKTAISLSLCPRALSLSPFLHFLATKPPQIHKISSPLHKPHLKSPPLGVLKIGLHWFRTGSTHFGLEPLEARVFQLPIHFKQISWGRKTNSSPSSCI